MSDWRRLVFLIGSVIVMIMIMKRWKRQKISALLITVAYGICFGYVSAAAVLIVAVLIATIFFVEKHMPDTPVQNRSSQQESRLDEQLSYGEQRELAEMERDAKRFLAPGDYAQFNVLAKTCWTKKDFKNLKRTWEPLIEQLKR